MSDELLILLSFLLFMGFFAGVGLASVRVKKDTTDDYLVAGRGMHPALAALSAACAAAPAFLTAVNLSCTSTSLA